MSRWILLSLILLLGCVATTHYENDTPQSNISAPNCTDSDGGYNIFTKGSAAIKYVDFCQNNLLTEYFCYNDSIHFETLNCPNGTVCSDGACIVNVIQDNKTIEDFCVDSDNGTDVYVAGSVIAENETYRDSCYDATSVLEYLCDHGKMFNTVLACGIGNICQNGICVNLSKTCIETDSEDEYELGKIVQSIDGLVLQSKYDSCYDNTTITEYYCNNGEISSKTLPCQNEDICSGGRCISVCFDGDGGIDISNASYVKDLTDVYNDYCYDKYTVIDYTCDNGVAKANQETCEIICKSGKCYDDEVTCQEQNSGKTIKLVTTTSTIDSASDFCIDYMTKKDYQCIDNKIGYEEVECDSDEFCYSGNCYEITTESCYDMDSGAYYNGRRTASYILLTSSSSIDDVKYDYCVSNTMVAEYSCSGTKTAIDFYDCIDGAQCIDGACSYPYTCVDSHNGNFGYVTIYQNGATVSTEYDTCTSDLVVRRTGCNMDGSVSYTLVECQNGTTCNNGSCD